MHPYFLGFDLGSSSCKGCLMDSRGHIKASVSQPQKTSRPRSDWAEQDPEEWWSLFKGTVRGLLEKARLEPRQIGAVGVTGFVPGLVALDASGSVIRPCIMHTDTRAGRELRQLSLSREEPLSLGMLLPKLLWFRKNEPALYGKTRTILNPHSFLAYKLTGRAVCDHDTASLTGLVYDEAQGQWNHRLCRELDLDSDLFPPLLASCDIAGTLSDKAGTETGLNPGTPVIAGTGDSMASLLGTGAFHPGDFMIYLGTSATRIHVRTPLVQLLKGLHFGKGRAEFTGTILSCGESMEQYGKVLGFTSWEIPDARALSLPPDPDLFVLPHFKQKEADSASFKNRESLFGLLPGHSPFHIYRALLEGIAFNLKQGLPSEAQDIKRIILCGGGAKSEVFCRVISEVLGRPLLRNRFGSASLGIALLAALGCGAVEDFDTIAAQWGGQNERIDPDPGRADLYRKKYGFYTELQRRLDDLYASLERWNNEETI